MLQSIRDKTQGIFAGIIVALIGIMFLFWGVGDYLNYQGNQKIAAQINGKQITWNEVAVESDRIARLNPMVTSAESIRPQVLEQMAYKASIMLSADENAITISNDSLRHLIQSEQVFHVDGVFSPERYHQYLQQAGMSESEFMARIRESMIERQLLSAESAGAFIDDGEKSRLANLVAQERAIQYQEIDLAKFEKGIELTEEELRAFYQSNPNLFMAPKTYDLSTVLVSAEDFKVSATDEDAKEYYNNNINQFNLPERRRVAHIMLANDEQGRQQLEDIQAQIKNGADFAELAKAHSLDKLSAEKGGEFPGMIAEREQMGLFEVAALKIEQGEMSDIVESEFGLHLIKVIEVVAPETVPFDMAKADIAKYLEQEEREARFIDIFDAINTAIYEQPQNIEAVGKIAQQSVNTEVLTDAAVMERYRHPNVAQAMAQQDFLEGNAVAVEVGPDALLVMKANQITEPHQKAFDVSLVEPFVMKQKRYAKAIEWAREAGDKGLTKAQELTVKRETTDLSPAIVDKIYSLPTSAIGNVAVLGDGQKLYSVKLKEINTGEAPEALNAQLTKWYGELLSNIARKTAFERVNFIHGASS